MYGKYQEQVRIHFTVNFDNVTFIIVTDDAIYLEYSRVKLMIAQQHMVYYCTGKQITTELYSTTPQKLHLSCMPLGMH